MNKWLSRFNKNSLAPSILCTDNTDRKFISFGVSVLSVQQIDNIQEKHVILSALSVPTVLIPAKVSHLHKLKTQEVGRLIKLVSDNHGGDDASFLEEYINNIIRDWSHDLDAAIACFHEIVTRQEG